MSVPARFQDLFDDAEQTIAEFRRTRGLEPTLFVAADYVGLYYKMKEIVEHGDLFLEWGSGVGAITIIADLLGYNAYGIEIEPDLVDFAVELADRHGSEAEFVAGTFVPESHDWSSPHSDANFHTDPSGQDGYDVLDMSPEEFDVIYAYPWPGEDLFLKDVFEQCARPGALFLTYHGLDGIQTYRKPLLDRED